MNFILIGFKEFERYFGEDVVCLVGVYLGGSYLLRRIGWGIIGRFFFV